MERLTFACFVAHVTGIALLSQSAFGTVTYSSMGTSPQYDDVYFYRLSRFSPATEDRALFQFQPSMSGPLTNIRVAASRAGSVRPAIIEIFASDNNTVGQLLWSTTVTLPSLLVQADPAPSFPIADGLVLQSSQQYFFSIRAATTGFLTFWSTPIDNNNVPLTTTLLATPPFIGGPFQYVPNQPPGAFELSVPSPGVCLCFTAAFGVGMLRRRRPSCHG